MAFDLQKDNFGAVAETGVEVELTLPTGEGSGAYLTILGEQSKTVKAYGRKLFQMWQQKQSIAKRKGREEELSLEEAEEQAIDAACVRVIGWKGITEEGKDVKFSKEKLREILAEHAWIREFIMQESNNIYNFRPK